MILKTTLGRWLKRTNRKVGGVLRLFAVFLVVLQIVYTPIHLTHAPHSDELESSVAMPSTPVANIAGEDEDSDHHERHSADQHNLTALRPQRAALADMVLVPAVEWVINEQVCPLPLVFEFSGLSPPEFVSCWQFHFRAALPIRAPSLLA